LERIDRDIEELNNLQMGIREDREYATRIMDPLLDESSRLKKLRSKILSQSIKNPPENLTESIQLQKNTTPEVEITIQRDHRIEKPPEEQKKTQISEKNQVKHVSPPKSEQKKSNPYRFIFEQNN
jgi:hypothetical protein